MKAPSDGPDDVSYVVIDGIEITTGSRVRLRPGGHSDIMDIALSGRLARVEAVERDYDDRIHVAVSVEDDPGQDLGAAWQVGHRFFFSPDELERVE